MRLRPGPRIALPRTPLRDAATLLRPWRDDDVGALVALCQDQEIVRWIGISAAYGPEDARAYLRGCEESARAGAGAHLAIADAGDATLLGSVALPRVDWNDRRAEVGYWLGAAARGRGHATRAVALVCRWGFRELALERIALLAAVGNPASQAVAARAGFTREAVLRAYDAGPDGREDVVCFSRLAADRPPAGP